MPVTPGASQNVVMIVLDDLGFAELGCYGSAISTPNIDLLADRGLRYNQFHVTPLCSPTRACLLTGRNHHAVGMGFLSTDLPSTAPGYTGRIPKTAGTLPRVLRDAGFNTFAVGKWHLTPRLEEGPAGPFERWPLGLGFERYYGFIQGNTDQWVPELIRDNGYVEPPVSPHDGYHLTEDLADQAIRFIQDQQQAAPGKPFFMYLATGAMHSPHQVHAEWVRPYEGKFDEGWEAVRSRTFLEQQRLGIVPPGATLTERPSWVRPWEDLPGAERRMLARQMEVYAGFLSHTDAQIGRVIQALAALGVLEDTLIMVLSDNGAAPGGAHGMFNLFTQLNDVDAMVENMDHLGGARAYNSYANGWAWAGNTPFKLWKHYTWLGGVRVPLIVQWPARIPASGAGEVRSQFCHAIDLMPTILDAVGVEPPVTIDGATQMPLDGKSIAATFDDPDADSPRITQYFEMQGSRAIYHDGWKATTNHLNEGADLLEGSREFETDRWSLYCLRDDFAEADDLAEDEPGKLRQLTELWWHEAGKHQALPLSDKAFAHRLDSAKPPFPAVAPPRKRYTCMPNGAPVETPSPFVGGFRVTAQLDIPENHSANGVVCAQHLRTSGSHSGAIWACYFLDGRLVVAFNVDDTVRKVIADEPVTAGACRVGIAYAPRHPTGGGFVSITIDGRGIGGIANFAKPPHPFGHIFAGILTIGRDYGWPVCDDYRPPFHFSGQIQSVVYDAEIGPGCSAATSDCCR